MPARSFIGAMEQAARSFYATALRHEVSDANVRGYLRAASQIEQIWQECDERVRALQDQGVAPWDAYYQARYALAFIRAARTFQVFVQELLAADATFGGTEGFLPRVTFDQANAFCHQIQPNLQAAVAALNDPGFTPDVTVPQALHPRIEAEDAPCPVAHLEGMISAAREVREWAAGLSAQYEDAVLHAPEPAPSDVQDHLTALRRMLAEGDSLLQFGVDLVGQVSQGEATNELHEDAEDNLWAALELFFTLNQVVAAPDWLALEDVPGQANHQQVYHDKRIKPSDLWVVAAPSARAELRGTDFGTQEMHALVTKMGGILSAEAQAYLHDVAAAVKAGDVIIVGAMSECPFEPLYRTRHAIEIVHARIPTGHEFHWDYRHGRIEEAKRFQRSDRWEDDADRQ